MHGEDISQTTNQTLNIRQRVIPPGFRHAETDRNRDSMRIHMSNNWMLR